ncbi:ribosomal RNA-processing protein 7 homolog A [Anthonomus grandis grandis]|uniref:ribosomal RNA-processing protein 7 homolog A n=1 Tax=Anthonomus grandis grandis TaxID=2921223 RepID=UPI00216666CE|nr:ribosomal RNA-processing protein 7 homolog A [Anthonomus grandis grandis]
MISQPRKVQGYNVISVKLSQDTSTSRDFFVKPNSAKFARKDRPADRTLFVQNIPPYLSEEALKKLFTLTNEPHSVQIENSSQGCGKVAYVVFNTQEQFKKALNANSLTLGDFPLHVGLEKWISEYNNSIVDHNKLSTEITKLMQTFDKQEAAEKKKTTEVDDEGWTVVTGKGRNPAVANKASTQIKLNKKVEEGKKKKELKNFYSFQIKESKKKNLEVLKKNYEEAKKKVNLMKSQRRFKPY